MTKVFSFFCFLLLLFSVSIFSIFSVRAQVPQEVIQNVIPSGSVPAPGATAQEIDGGDAELRAFSGSGRARRNVCSRVVCQENYYCQPWAFVYRRKNYELAVCSPEYPV
ncbi:hypothetical protein G9A89_010937 [Geosiphon pyriformis]|nr:hypothetical protein G9A89_010937 [Geosiphon pyriformis]